MTAYYFRKLARYLIPREYNRVKLIRSRTNPQISIAELLFLRWGLRKSKPGTAVEIGSFCGASTALLADQVQRLGTGRIYAIDLFSKSSPASNHGSEYWKRFDETMAPYAGLFEKVEGDSKTVPWKAPIDFLFIDGDHTEAGADSDIRRFTPFVRGGGYVFVHDCIDSPETDSWVETVVNRTLVPDPTYRKLGLVDSLMGFQKIS